MPETSLKSLMASCTDFEEEETLLQHMGKTMGVVVNWSPKCHTEIAGEGIEYSWGCAKNHYWRVVLDKKRGRDNFLRTVRECISETIITREKVQKFARHARRYVLGYHVLWQIQQGVIKDSSNSEEQTSTSDNLAIIPAKLEQMVKKFKTHRCAMEFDHGFCKTIFKEEN
jgi:hypothetical protein